MGNIDHGRMPDHQYIERVSERTQFIRDYKSCLLDLTKKERDVILLWFDRNMEHSYTAEEIGIALGMNPRTVKSTKDKALKKIKENPKMQKYKGLLGQ